MDKKAIVLLGVFLAIVGAGVLFAFMFVLKPPAQHESGAATSSEFHFPATQRPPAGQEPVETAADMSAGDEPSAPVPGGSSLGFVKKDKSIVGGVGGPTGGGNASGDAAQAAAKGDVAGMMSELRRGGGGDVPEADSGAKKMAASTVRDLMQRVVDVVHKAQPAWYNEFLKDKGLKAIADRYDQSQDFKGFVKGLAGSQAFHGMMKKYYKTKGMRALTKTLMGEQPTGSQLSQLFLENAKDANVLKMVSAYGQDAGLPAEMVEHASDLGPEAERQETAQARRAPPARLDTSGQGKTIDIRLKKKGGDESGFSAAGPRPKLKSVGFGSGNFSSGGNDRSKQQVDPAQAAQAMQNVDPKALEQYKKFLNKGQQ